MAFDRYGRSGVQGGGTYYRPGRTPNTSGTPSTMPQHQVNPKSGTPSTMPTQYAPRPAPARPMPMKMLGKPMVPRVPLKGQGPQVMGSGARALLKKLRRMNRMGPMGLAMNLLMDNPWAIQTPNPLTAPGDYNWGPEWTEECTAQPNPTINVGPEWKALFSTLGNSVMCAGTCATGWSNAWGDVIPANVVVVYGGLWCKFFNPTRFGRQVKRSRPFPGSSVSFRPQLPYPYPLPGWDDMPAPAISEKGYPRAKHRTQPRSRPGARAWPMPDAVALPEPRPGPGSYRPPYENPPGHENLPGKERTKYKVPHATIGDLYGKLTEFKDGLKCFEEALGPNYRRPKGGGLYDRAIKAAGHAWEKPHDVDWNKFVGCLIVNHAQDYAIGKANQLANRITKSPYWVRPVGQGFGGFGRRMNSW